MRITTALLVLFVGLYPASIFAQTATVQPVFRFPLADGYRSLCTQGNNVKAPSHNLASTKYALDFDTPNAGQAGDPVDVIAAADGIAYVYDGCVFGKTGCNSGFGNHIKVSHGPRLFTIYAHLSDILVSHGSPVRQGDVIGIEGSTGNSVNKGKPADHLHFSVQSGAATSATPGTSVPMEYMTVLGKTGAAMWMGKGASFKCGIPGGAVYEAIDVPECHTIRPGDPIPTGYGAPYNVVLNNVRSPELLRAVCPPTDRIRVSVGDNEPVTYVFTTGHEWVDNVWKPFTFQCVGKKEGEWCIGTGIANIFPSAPYFLAYTCTVQQGVSKCGCRDSACTTSYWQLQKTR